MGWVLRTRTKSYLNLKKKKVVDDRVGVAPFLNKLALRRKPEHLQAYPDPDQEYILWCILRFTYFPKNLGNPFTLRVSYKKRVSLLFQTSS